MWLHKPPEFTVPVLVPETMPDTIARCLNDGWTECADPRLPVEAPSDEALMPSLTAAPIADASTAQVPSKPKATARPRSASKPGVKPTAKARR